MRLRIAAGIALCCIALQSAPSEDFTLAENTDAAKIYRISKVRLIIDGSASEWTAEGLSAAIDQNPKISNETVISFLLFKPGKEGSDAAFLRWCRESELRLLQSGYVYEASVLVVPPRKNPEERTIIVSVASGFFFRFGGGNAWGMIGKDGLGGDRASVRLYAGLNRNGGEYMHYRAFGLPLILGGRLYYNGPGDTDVLKDTAGLTSGWFINPDLVAGLDAAWKLPDFPSTDNGIFSFGPFITYRKGLVKASESLSGREGDFGTDVGVSLFPGVKAANGEVSSFVHLHPLRNTEIALFAGAGKSLNLDEAERFSSSGAPLESAFDLYYTEDRNVRSGYADEELLASAFTMSSLELRQKAITIPFADMFKCDVQLFLFADVAGIVPALSYDTSDSSDLRLVDAYGGGVRLLFDNPIFAYFSFSYGMNHEGDGRFLFCGTAGY